MRELVEGLVVLTLCNIGLVALLAVLPALFPTAITRTLENAQAIPGRCLLIGTVNGIFLGAVILALRAIALQAGSQLIGLLGGLLLAALLAGMSFGLAAFAQLVGQRLALGRPGTPQTLWGALALSLACELPFLGWFLLFPYVALAGLGAFILSFFGTRRAGREQEGGERRDGGAG